MQMHRAFKYIFEFCSKSEGATSYQSLFHIGNETDQAS